MPSFKAEQDNIPVGYLTKLVADVEKHDVLKVLGKVNNVKFVGKQDFTTSSGESYEASAIEIEIISSLTGRKLYHVLPLTYEVEILQYASLKNFEPEYLPLESPNYIYYPPADNEIVMMDLYPDYIEEEDG